MTISTIPTYDEARRMIECAAGPILHLNTDYSWVSIINGDTIAIPHTNRRMMVQQPSSYHPPELSRPVPAVKRGNMLPISAAHKRLMRKVKFNRTQIGIEFTTIPPLLYDGVRDYEDELLSFAVRPKIMTDIGEHRLIDEVGSDPGCIEIPSSIMRRWHDTLSFSRLCLTTAHKYECKQESPHHTGGGGHIHISHTDWHDESSDATSDALIKYTMDRPWIAWAFQDPHDNETSVNARNSMWGSAVADRYNNIEFRFFNSARTIEEQIEHVAFALKLFKVGLKLPEVEWEVLRSHKMKRPSLAKALRGWKQTIRELGLPWKLYRQYARNIRARYKLGKEYLK